MANSDIQVSLHSTGLEGVGLNSEGEIVGRRGRFLSRAPHDQIVLFDDFLGDVIADQWNVVEGADTATSDAAVVNGLGGILRLTTGDSATTTYAGNGIQVTTGAFLNFRAAEGGLSFETRVRLNDITTAAFFVGFTDVGTFEAPIEGSGTANGITTTATDAVGFIYDTRMTTANIWGVGVANNVDAVPVNTGVAPVNDIWVRLRVEVSAAGVATYYVNGVLVGQATGAVTPTVALTPTVAATSLVSGATRLLSVDYIEAVAHRY